MRVQANLSEYLPVALLWSLLMELNGLAVFWLHAFGGTLIALRIVHAVALSGHTGTSVA